MQISTLEAHLKKVNDFIVDNKVDAYKVLVYNFPTIRIKLNNPFRESLRNSILKKYNSFLNFARKEEFLIYEDQFYTIVRNWFKEKNCSFIPVAELLKICNIFNIHFSEMLDQIELFVARNRRILKIPRYIQIDTELMYSLGLYLGEGKNDTKRRTRVAISNTDFAIARFTVHWFDKYFRVAKGNLKFYANIPKMADRKSEIQKLAKEFLVPESQVFTHNSDLCRLVDVAVSFDAKYLRLLIDWMKENLIALAITNKEFGAAFAQGVLDGEGHVQTKKTNNIILEMRNDLVLDTVELIYWNLGLTPNRKDNNNTVVVRLGDFDKLACFGAFRLCRKSREAFETARKNVKHKQVRSNHALVESLRILSKHNDFEEMRNLTLESNYTNRCSIGNVLRLAVKRGYASRINLSDLRKGRSSFCYKITPSGAEYIKSIDDIDEQRSEQLTQNICQMLCERWV